MKLSEYLKDPDVVVKRDGQVLQGDLCEDVEMEDCLAKRTVHGLITVASIPGRKARSIQMSMPRELSFSPNFAAPYGNRRRY